MKRLLVAVALLFSAQVMACDEGEIAFKNVVVCAELTWIVGPSLNEFNSAVVRLDSEAYTLKAYPWMKMANGHEHGSRPVTQTALTSADYQIEKIFFMGGMKGEWYLNLELYKNGVLEDKSQVLINL